jgi:exosortase
MEPSPGAMALAVSSPFMKTKPLLALLGLGILAAVIWLRGTLGMTDAADTLPLLAAFPLYYWLTRPWMWKTEPAPRLPRTVFVGLALTLVGVVADSTFLLSVAWIAFLDAFEFAFLEKIPRRLMILPFLGFPWLTQNMESLGWIFRYTGAGAVQFLFTILGMTVHREGTLLFIGNLPLSIEPACAGLNVLQSMLIVGCLLICIRIRGGWRFWSAIASLIPLAWLANTLRIFMLGSAAVLFGSDFASGWFHKWGGWLVLCLMFLLCERVFNLLAGKRRLLA